MPERAILTHNLQEQREEKPQPDNLIYPQEAGQGQLPIFESGPAAANAELKQKKGEAARGEAPNHVLIEGDNLHALTVLNYTHAGKVDVIYIDPPYNTGNKNFIYNDQYVDREDSYRHSKWLSFMHKRLKLAKNLLKEFGVIFISIDDYEPCFSSIGSRSALTKTCSSATMSKTTTSTACLAKAASTIPKSC